MRKGEAVIMAASPLCVSRLFERNELNQQNTCESNETEEGDSDETEVVHPTNQAVVCTKCLPIRDTFENDMVETDTPSGTCHDSDEQSVHITSGQHDC